MTDNDTRPAPPPVITGNIRAEMARVGLTVEQARTYLGRQSATLGTWRPMSATTWEERMRNPGSWRVFELAQLARALGITPSDLVRGA